MSLIGDEFLWEPVAARHYGELIKELNGSETSSEVVISATILLFSYELLARPGADYQKHLYCARSPFQGYDMVRNGTDVEHVSFWIYARQDVSMALVHESATFIAPETWPAVPQLGEMEEGG